jgi:hypothetical protein
LRSRLSDCHLSDCPIIIATDNKISHMLHTGWTFGDFVHIVKTQTDIVYCRYLELYSLKPPVDNKDQGTSIESSIIFSEWATKD